MENTMGEMSSLFFEIYQHFNVGDQVEKMKKLSQKELYYLLICCMDHHDEDDPIVIANYTPFESEINEILELQETEKTKNQYLIELQNLTGDQWINTNKTNLPTPYTKNEVRELKLNNILDK